MRGDCHTHSDWSDGGSPPGRWPPRPAIWARMDALTDHSPRLTVARGLSPERLTAQLDLVGKLNEQLAPFRILTGIEVDILEDGSLDQRDDLLAHWTWWWPAGIRNSGWTPRDDGPDAGGGTQPARGRPRALHRPAHTGRGRPPSQFDAPPVFTACRESGTAVEVEAGPNARIDRRSAGAGGGAGCLFPIDTDAHAPGQLDWLGDGCRRAEAAGVTPNGRSTPGRRRPDRPHARANADFRTGTSALGSGEFEVEQASVPPGDGGVGGQVGFAEDG